MIAVFDEPPEPPDGDRRGEALRLTRHHHVSELRHGALRLLLRDRI